MTAITDYIIILAGLFFIYSGWKKGFFHTLLNPLSVILGTIAAFFYYSKQENITITFLIGFLSPFILSFILAGIVKLKNKALKKEPELSKPSRFLGSFICLLWGTAWIFCLLILLVIIPSQQKWIEIVRQDVIQSKTYILLNHFLGESIQKTQNLIQLTPEKIENLPQIKEIRALKEYEDLISNEKFKDFIADQEVMDYVKNKNISKLLMNPKMKTLLEDKDFIKNMLKVNQELLGKDFPKIEFPDLKINKNLQEDHLPMQN